MVASGKLIGVQVFPEEPEVVATFREVLDHIPEYLVVTVTLPIGLPSAPRKGGRKADTDARAILGFPHAGAISSTPTRASLACARYEEARKANGGLLDVVTWQQFKRIRELDSEMQPYLQRKVYEVRPELSFLQLNDDVAMKHTKDSKAGQAERQELLRRRMPGSERILDYEGLPVAVRLAHRTDACGALWTARRVVAKAISRVPEDPEWDENGLRMQIVR
ncbi:MAG: hypothetical protein QOK42_2497 [Frankiaceae bacterium]|jgi:predicted RNase H-like nuclease|nr:hypothetical protein [Frankiaceae bacterium]MDX6224780.1 hypothetical protein [Frankiales bacterium]MDX6275645.1 hypothetical protein [Frankiales bacterium]